MTQKQLVDNNEEKPKGKPRGKPFPKGVSGNPAGAPTHTESWAGIIKKVGNMTPTQAGKYLKDIKRQLNQLGDELTLKELVVLRAFSELALTANASIMNALMDRGEGKVPQTLAALPGTGPQMSWRDFVEGVKAIDEEIQREEVLEGVEVTDA